jgi:hypothetical protein
VSGDEGAEVVRLTEDWDKPCRNTADFAQFATRREPEWIGIVNWVAACKSIQVHPAGEANGIFLREPPTRRIIVPVPLVEEPRCVPHLIDRTANPTACYAVESPLAEHAYIGTRPIDIQANSRCRPSIERRSLVNNAVRVVVQDCRKATDDIQTLSVPGALGHQRPIDYATIGVGHSAVVR